MWVHRVIGALNRTNTSLIFCICKSLILIQDSRQSDLMQFFEESFMEDSFDETTSPENNQTQPTETMTNQNSTDQKVTNQKEGMTCLSVETSSFYRLKI